MRSTCKRIDCADAPEPENARNPTITEDKKGNQCDLANPPSASASAKIKTASLPKAKTSSQQKIVQRFCERALLNASGLPQLAASLPIDDSQPGSDHHPSARFRRFSGTAAGAYVFFLPIGSSPGQQAESTVSFFLPGPQRPEAMAEARSAPSFHHQVDHTSSVAQFPYRELWRDSKAQIQRELGGTVGPFHGYVGRLIEFPLAARPEPPLAAEFFQHDSRNAFAPSFYRL